MKLMSEKIAFDKADVRKSIVMECGLSALCGARLSPPSHLSKPERTLFAEIVGSCDPRHFANSDLPLLTSFVQATLEARSGPGGGAADWEKVVKVQAMLATRLRLTP